VTSRLLLSPEARAALPVRRTRTYVPTLRQLAELKALGIGRGSRRSRILYALAEIEAGTVREIAARVDDEPRPIELEIRWLLANRLIERVGETVNKFGRLVAVYALDEDVSERELIYEVIAAHGPIDALGISNHTGIDPRNCSGHITTMVRVGEVSSYGYHKVSETESRMLYVRGKREHE
jgi:predicted ArsR family transcriptional regulator